MAITTTDRENNVTVTYKGAVLRVYNDNYRIMSDMWCTAEHAFVWDETKGAPRTIVTRIFEGTPENVVAEVDATADVMAAYRKHLIAKEVEKLTEAEVARVAKPVKGSVIKVARGRSDKGKVGKVVVKIEGRYKMGWQSVAMMKLGVALSDEMVEVERNGKVFKNHKDMIWVWEKNADVLDKEEVNMVAVYEDAIAAADEKIARMMK